MPTRRRREAAGQSMVEFALVLPVFILILIGLFDVGRAIHAYNTVANAARAGARVAIVNQDETEIRDRVLEMGGSIGLTDADVTLASCSTAGCPFSITVEYVYVPATPLIGNVFNPTISSTAQMPVEFSNP
jgi:Flp pilus assembly protein TadG